jgi:L-alanine-DL-glutamate epimerase-like enolase superfamily enzyme
MNSPIDLPLLRARPLDLKLARPFTISRGSKDTAQNVLVEIEHEGVMGRGEAAPNSRYGQSQQSTLAALDQFSPPQAAFASMDALAIMASFREQAPEESAAHAALEMAMWDWAGHRAGKPLYEMFGIEPGKLPVSSWTLSIDEPEGLAARIEESARWPVLKLKMSGGDADIRAIELLRERTERPFRVDANEAWSEDEAAEKIPWLASVGCQLVEQPLPAGQLDAMRRLAKSSALPLIADEDAPNLLVLDELVGAFHGVNIKLMKCGGLRNAIQMVHAARARGFSLMLGCMIESSIAISAAAQIAALVDWTDLDGAALLAADPFVGATVCGGEIQLSKAPGLGVHARPEATATE